MKILCTSPDSLPANLGPDEQAFSFFRSNRRAGVGNIAIGWKRLLKRTGFAPDAAAWDFVQLCLAVCAADLACPRATSADGWTRVIDLTVGLHEPVRWIGFEEHVEKMLKLLTGDYWKLHFVVGGEAPPAGKVEAAPHDCVCLLSGGLDSLVGGIDLVSQGRRPVFVSQLAHDDSAKQIEYARQLGGPNAHCQWSHGINFPGQREPSTRARSLAFYAFAVLAASRVGGEQVQVFVPENGFICINPPLVPGRVSSLSTKTTHPQFISMMQELLNGIGLSIVLELPYRFKTKGEMLRECLNQELLEKLASGTTSCGRFRTYNRRHCGRCVPCMIRKGAFHAWGAGRDRTDYKHESLLVAEKSSGPDDAMAAALAVLTVQERGLERFLGATLAFAPTAYRESYRETMSRGLAEVEAILRRDGVL
ncbi:MULTISPECIES: Qat anti-phage system QueC-like protein QatC [unclassified Caballeronia]|uniref:Qat anti-phage system QueC-like protein QatC n=1 Tax=unclassified Caballeronia TaxID=2646786 RepID=UPI001F20A19D|nr:MULTISPECIES: Qat anti-phage system QueC-like protein QatC [unclassified Caballeronia]MCE4543044.1 7-cyano-7-deazaguanine synthase [Caballeronia sp. PC1]MCE4567900.1 7-cyano-7-deazaguanine synthase [Caballeronia sp. CLC5]